MNSRGLKQLGMTLGIVVIILAFLHLQSTWASGDTNWYLIVMICGMLLLLYYSIGSSNRRGRRR